MPLSTSPGPRGEVLTSDFARQTVSFHLTNFSPRWTPSPEVRSGSKPQNL